MPKVDCCWNCGWFEWSAEYNRIWTKCECEKSPYYKKEVNPDCICEQKDKGEWY